MGGEIERKQNLSGSFRGELLQWNNGNVCVYMCWYEHKDDSFKKELARYKVKVEL